MKAIVTPTRAKITALDIVQHKTMRSMPILSPLELKSKTQRNALTLMEREEKNAKKSRLESLLQHQFLAKYGSKVESSINEFIKTVIREFIDSYVNVADAEPHISVLEKQLKVEVNRMRDDIKEQKRQLKRREEEERKAKERTEAEELERSRRQDTGKRLQDFQDNQWPIINAIVALTEEEQKRKEMQDAATRKMKFKQQLDEQLATRSQLQTQQMQEQNQIFESIRLNKVALDQEQEKQRAHREYKLKQERTIRLEQIEEQRQRREQERNLKIAQEKVEITRALRLAQEEADFKRQEKERRKALNDKLLEENEYNQQVKAMVLKEKQEYERRLAAEHERKREAEERARQEAFTSRMNHLQNISKGYEQRVGSVLQRKAEAEEQQQLQVIQQQEKLALERDLKAKEDRRIKAKRDLDFNIKMMEMKAQEKQDERWKAMELRKQLEEDAREAKRLERMEAEQRRIKHVELKYDLDNQLETLQETRRQQKVGMSKLEMAANQSLIKKLEEDPALMSRVLQRVNEQESARKPAANSQVNKK